MAGVSPGQTNFTPELLQQMQRNLDSTINQRLSMSFTMKDSSSGSVNHSDQIRKSIVTLSPDVFSFARFLSKAKCLEILLFWKEVENYKTIFTGGERQKIASKIYQQYCVEGAQWQVNFRGDHVKAIESALENKSSQPPDDLFDHAQLEVYELMRLDLYPRFYEEIQETLGGTDEEKEEPATSLGVVLSGTKPAAVRSFTRFCQEQYCEEALLFWMEAHSFTLLFQQMDLDTNAKVIYENYMGPSAKYKVNVSGGEVDRIKGVMDEQAVDNTLFVKAQNEVELFLDLDVFPRYEEWLATQASGPAPATKRDTPLAAAGLDREAARKETERLLSDPETRNAMRLIGSELDASENVDFYIEIQKYKLLFGETDKKETAVRIWDRYLDFNSEHLVTLPDQMHRTLNKAVHADGDIPLDVFAKAEKETLHLITDNMYPAYLKKQQAAAATPSPAPAATTAAGGGGGGGGGCCLIL